jgi:DNA-binding response OmpR family regulator
VAGIIFLLKRNTMKILIIEDETKVAMALKHGLESENFKADTAFAGENGLLCSMSKNTIWLFSI